MGASPKVFFVHNMLSEDEAEFLIKHGSSSVKTSTVGSRNPTIDPGRTSDGIFHSNTPISEAIIERVYDVLRIPYDRTSADGLQIVRYNPGKFYNSHLDYLEEANGSPENTLGPNTGGD
jgi:hypothetical protein